MARGRHRLRTPTRVYVIRAGVFCALCATAFGVVNPPSFSPENAVTAITIAPTTVTLEPPVPPVVVSAESKPTTKRDAPQKDAGPTTTQALPTTKPAPSKPPKTTTKAPAVTTTKEPEPVAKKVETPVQKPVEKRVVASSSFGGVAPHVAVVGNFLQQQFGVKSVGGVGSRPGNPTSDHPRGLALDLMVDRSTGDALNACALAHKAEWNITYTLWQVADHYDHVHISFEPSGAVSNLSC